MPSKPKTVTAPSHATFTEPSRTHLFTARSDGYHVCRIPGLLVTPRGVAIATTEARFGTGGDWDPIDIRMRRSTDGGRTWDAARVIIDHRSYGDGPINNCALIGDRDDGRVHVLYCYNYARVFHMTSDDDGLTFSAPVEITAAFAALRAQYPWRVVAVGPGHGIQLRNGRFVVPTWLSDGGGTEHGVGKLGHRPSVVTTVVSDDHGRTWRCGDIVAHDCPAWRNPSETVAVELSDGRVLFNIRNEGESHRRLIAISPDGIGQWSQPTFDQALIEPVCMANILRLSGDRNRVLFVNPDNATSREMVKNWPGCAINFDRRNLTLQVSYDDCRTWTVKKVLEAGPSGYADIAQLPDGSILCLYEDQHETAMFDDKYITCARFDLAWVTDGRDS